MLDTSKNKITDYAIVSGTTAALTTAIKDRLNNGWTLYGDPFYTASQVINQAVVKFTPITSAQTSTITYS